MSLPTSEATSLPPEVQVAMVRAVEGLEEAEVVRPGYAVEYDYVDPTELETTLDLRRAVVRAVGPARVGGIDPATRTFQALRIAVNDELGEIEALLAALPRVLRPDAVAAIISFHSLEDRLVKHAFHDQGTWTPLTKKPLLPTDEERGLNPRSRSAQLRAARLSPRRKD
jgi:16S rRNA (cytosine1402-N4)-methyltransferase